MLGVSPAGARLPIDIRSLVRRGITLRGVVEGDSVPSVFIPTLVEHYREGRFPLDRLIQRYALNEINRALDDAATCAVVKPVVIF
jgi:aryl-alcohol dehydrogenase